MQTLKIPGRKKTWELPLEAHKVGMICFLCSEIAFFSTLIMAYVVFLFIGGPGPTPQDTLKLPLVTANTFVLISSSGTIYWAERKRRKGQGGRFLIWWGLTFVLGVTFLIITAIEWNTMITDHGFTINRNTFGSSYYTLVGFHAFHVTMGVTALMSIWLLAAASQFSGPSPLPITLVAWYWHFVDVVWVVVYSTVYLFGR